MIITYRYRVLPSKAQHRVLEHILESQRQLYNAALEERIGAYRKAGRTLTYFDQTKGLTEWRRSDGEAAKLPVALQRATLKRLDEAYKGFFRRIKNGGKPGFPRFRGKGWFDSFGFQQFEAISLESGGVRFKGLPGRLRVHWHRKLPSADIKYCTFRRDPKGWVIALAIETESAPACEIRHVVGVDLGISTFAALSDGGFIPSQRAARRSERRLRVAQRAVSRKKRGSSGRRKAKLHCAGCHAAVHRQRREHLHQASARLVRDYDAIVVENLEIKGLAAGVLAKDVRDASWATFISMLRYKAERAGALFIEVDPRFTSQDCSACAMRVPKDLSVRHHQCPRCGLLIDRDLNAARNILARAGVGPGLSNVADRSMRADGNLWSSAAETTSARPESLPAPVAQ